MGSYSVFNIDTSVHSMDEVLGEITEMGHSVSRTGAVWGAHYPDARGYSIIGTDISLMDPRVIPGHGSHPVIGVFCPSRTMYVAGMEGATHDPDINKKIYNRLKRKFDRKKK